MVEHANGHTNVAKKERKKRKQLDEATEANALGTASATPTLTKSIKKLKKAPATEEIASVSAGSYKKNGHSNENGVLLKESAQVFSKSTKKLANKIIKNRPAVATKGRVYQPFRYLTVKMPILLSPCLLQNPAQGIREHLVGLLMKYSPELGGVILGFEDVQTVEKGARVLMDSPFCTFHVIVTLLVFIPKVNLVLTGVINKVSQDHIGLVVLGVFNASIPVDQIPSKVSVFMVKPGVGATKSQEMVSAEEACSINTVVKFAVTKIVAREEMMSLEGSLRLIPSKTGVVQLPNEFGRVLLPQEIALSQSGDHQQFEDEAILYTMANEAWKVAAEEVDSATAAEWDTQKPKKSKEKNPKGQPDALPEDSQSQTKPKKRKRTETDDAPSHDPLVTPAKTKKKKQMVAGDLTPVVYLGENDGEDQTPVDAHSQRPHVVVSESKVKNKKSKAKLAQRAEDVDPMEVAGDLVGAPSPTKTVKKKK